VVASGEGAELKERVLVNEKVLNVTLSPLFDDSGESRGFIRLMRDDTGERRANAQLREAERFATLGQLFSGVAHDVGTPLNVISGYAEFLLMRTKPDGQGYKELTAILEQTRRIAAVFGEALDLSRPPQGRVDAIEIKILLSDSLVLVGHHLRRANVKASITCRMTPPLIYGEAAQLRQALFNLLVNAAQQVGGGRLHVVIDQESEVPGFVALTFEGTDANEIAHDFSLSLAAFVSESENEPAGIGLYLAKSILEDAGAKIASKTGEQGKGLTVYLPIKPPVRHLSTMTSRS
jgi:signal transduction histidine kinase